MRRLLILFALATAFIGIGELEAQECERLYPQGLNKTCRAVQTPTVERVSLEAIAVTFDTEPERDYCRLEAVVHGDFTSFKQVLDDKKAKAGQGVIASNPRWGQMRPGAWGQRLNLLSVTDKALRFGAEGDKWFAYSLPGRFTYYYLTNDGVPGLLSNLSTASFFKLSIQEGNATYAWEIDISPPREATNLPALYQKCLSDIELAREAVKRRIYVTKQQVAIDLARQAAEAEVEFLNGEIEYMESAVEEIQSAITKAEEAIDQALTQRRALILIEEAFGKIINAFWSGTWSEYQTFYEWADGRLTAIDAQLAEAERFKADIEAIELQFLTELSATRLKAREKAIELEELGNEQ